jgi:hypothetical protein
MPNIKHNDETARQPNRQSGNVDERIAFVLEEISDRDSEVVFEHEVLLSHGAGAEDVGHWFTKVRKNLNFLCPTNGKTTNPGLPKALAGQADLKASFLHKVLPDDDTLYPLVVF